MEEDKKPFPTMLFVNEAFLHTQVQESLKTNTEIKQEDNQRSDDYLQNSTCVQTEECEFDDSLSSHSYEEDVVVKTEKNEEEYYLSDDSYQIKSEIEIEIDTDCGVYNDYCHTKVDNDGSDGFDSYVFCPMKSCYEIKPERDEEEDFSFNDTFPTTTTEAKFVTSPDTSTKEKLNALLRGRNSKIMMDIGNQSKITTGNANLLTDTSNLPTAYDNLPMDNDNLPAVNGTLASPESEEDNSFEDPNDRNYQDPSLNDTALNTHNKEKPKRPCKFCGTWNSQLTRHLKRKHKNEEEVMLALKLPLKEKGRAFASIRRAGILKTNEALRQNDENATFIRERRQGSSRTVMCSGCSGFYHSKYSHRHKSLCAKDMSQYAATDKMTGLSGCSLTLGDSNCQDHSINSADANSYNKTKPKRPCKFCGKWNSQLTRHLKRKHKNEEEVMLALKLPLKEQERTFASIRRAGILKINVGLGQNHKNSALIRERRHQGSSRTVMCSGCSGFYDAKYIHRHKSLCAKNMSQYAATDKITGLSEFVLTAEVDDDFKIDILDRFRQDPIGEICRTDLVTILLGKRQWALSFKRDRAIIMSEMRIIANLILAFRQESGDITAGGEDILNHRKFDQLVRAVKKISKTRDGKEKAGLKLRTGFILKRAVKVMKRYFVTKGEIQKKIDLSRFVSALNLNWKFIFHTSRVKNEQRRGVLRELSAMPIEYDVFKFRRYVLEEMEKMLDHDEHWGKHTFVKMRNLVVARLTMFNARRRGEPVRLTLNEWRDIITGARVDPNLVEQIQDPMEKYLTGTGNLKLAYQSEKGSCKLIPVLITKDSVAAITKLVAERANCCVADDNPFLFPNTVNSQDHASGYHCLKYAVENCPNLQQPHLLIADKYRYSVSTLFARFEVSEEERTTFHRHIGHSESINKDVYKGPMIVKEEEFLNKVDLQPQPGKHNQVVSSSGSTVPMSGTEDERSVFEGVIQQHENLPALPFTSEHEACQESGARPTLEISQNTPTRPYTKWSQKDSDIVETYFEKYITDITNKAHLPSKKELLTFLSTHDILEGHSNKAYILRTKIFNEKVKFRNCNFAMEKCPNLQQPHLIADKFRYRVSSLFAGLELSEEERASTFSMHMNYSKSINKDVYQGPITVKEEVFLNKVDLQPQPGKHNQVVSSSGSTVPMSGTEDDRSVIEGVIQQHEHLPALPFTSEHEACQESGARPTLEISQNTPTRPYTKWSQKDSDIVETYFEKYITDITNKAHLPSKKELLTFLSTHDILEGHSNKAYILRTKIFNEKVKFRSYSFQTHGE